MRRAPSGAGGRDVLLGPPPYVVALPWPRSPGVVLLARRPPSPATAVRPAAPLRPVREPWAPPVAGRARPDPDQPPEVPEPPEAPVEPARSVPLAFLGFPPLARTPLGRAAPLPAPPPLRAPPARTPPTREPPAREPPVRAPPPRAAPPVPVRTACARPAARARAGRLCRPGRPCWGGRLCWGDRFAHCLSRVPLTLRVPQPRLPTSNRCHYSTQTYEEGRSTSSGATLFKHVRRRPTLPRGPPRSTIGAEELNFRVRNGTGCFPFAITAETLLRCHRPSGPDGDRISGTAQWTRNNKWSRSQATRPISTGQLHTLPCFHLRPINPVV